MSNPGHEDLPCLEGSAGTTEAGAGWLLWLSLCAAFVFGILLITGEVGRGIAAGGLGLSAGLFLYERRRVRSVGRWTAGMGSGCASGMVMAGLGGKLLDLTGLVEVWDGRDQLTLAGIVTLWLLVALGMALSAYWTSPRSELNPRGKPSGD